MIFCDQNCNFASWPEKLSDGSSSCRTFIGLYCDKVEGIVHKNAPCVADLSDQDKIDLFKPTIAKN